MNKIFLIGNLTSDPELRTTPNGVSVCTMTLAVNRRSSSREERQTDFFRITAWRQLGETCSRFLSKGRKVAVVGELSARIYEAKDGTPRVSLEVTAEEVEFLSPRDQGQMSAQGGYQQQGYNRTYPQQGGRNDQSAASYQDAPRQNGWHDNRANSERNDFTGTAFDPSGSAADGFTEIPDDELPF